MELWNIMNRFCKIVVFTLLWAELECLLNIESFKLKKLMPAIKYNQENLMQRFREL